MLTITFTSYGEPVAKQRPKFFRRGNFVGTYTPDKTRAAEGDIRSASMATKPASLILGPITIFISAYKSIPKSLSKEKRKLAIEGTFRPITRPDWDNYAKLVCDALNQVYWKDDSQVVSAVVEKYYAAEPRTEIQIQYEQEGGEQIENSGKRSKGKSKKGS